MYGPRFTDEYKISKFAESVRVSRPLTGEILYFSNKLTQANNGTSVSAGEIRAGVGNRIVAIIPSDTNATAEITDTNLSLAMRAYQTGGLHGYGAPTRVCIDLKASGATLTIPDDKGTPVAGQGFSSVFCYVQTIGEASSILSDGIPYQIGSDGTIEGFTAVPGTDYKVWYWVNAATTEYTTILSYIDPNVVNLELSFPVFSNVKTDGTGTRIGSLVIIYPFFKLGGDATSNGDGSNNMTTSVSGMAISFEDSVIKAGCDACVDTNDALVHYLFVPCDGGVSAIQGLYLLGGEVTMDQNATEQLNFMLMVNGSPVRPDPAFMTYEVTTPLTGLSVSATGAVTSGSELGTAVVTATYTQGSANFTCPVNVIVTDDRK